MIAFLKTLWQAIVFALTNKKEATQPPPDILPSDLTPPPMPTPTEKTKGQLLYETAKGLLGQHVIVLDASTKFGVLGCAASVNAIFKKRFGLEIGGGLSTALMLSALKDKTRFKEVAFSEAEPGDILMYATGTSIKFPQAHGHVLIVGVRWCMSNSSETGTWEANYTREGVKTYFEDTMGFPPRVFRVL